VLFSSAWAVNGIRTFGNLDFCDWRVYPHRRRLCHARRSLPQFRKITFDHDARRDSAIIRTLTFKTPRREPPQMIWRFVYGR
jgi:hypothetical protein